MSVEELDRAAAALPEWEGSPSPASPVIPVDVAALFREVACDEAEYRNRLECRIEDLQKTRWTLYVLLASFLAGLAASWLVDCWMMGGQ